VETLAALLLRPGGRRLPVVVSGMAGVGKTYLVDRVFDENRAAFPGGYVRLSLDPESLPGAAGLLAQVADRLQLPGADAGAVARLAAPLTLLHVENIDTKEAGGLAADLAAAYPVAALVFTARLRTLGTMSGWGQISLAPFGDGDALAQLRLEVGDGAPQQQDWPELVAALGRLPLALHLAAGHLRHGGETPKTFLGCGRRAWRWRRSIRPTRRSASAASSSSAPPSICHWQHSGATAPQPAKPGRRRCWRWGGPRRPAWARAWGRRSPAWTRTGAQRWRAPPSACRCWSAWRGTTAPPSACTRCWPSWERRELIRRL
jgi:hypothetical protein